PPILEKNASHTGLNIIGATEVLKNHDTIVDVYPSTESINSEKTITFLENLIKINPCKKVYVVWDNAGTHTSNRTIKFLQDNKDKIEVIWLPKYSPTMNPQENLWNDLKAKLFRPSARSSLDEFVYDIYNIYTEYSEDPDKVYSLTNVRNFLT
ncbi:MAG: transposase, partial [Anaeromicrobium sp.]|uniref:transposase n=1 Tax=Anaeromicrobium sp. TaxID=1929132 RepID=UPI0025EBF54F